MVNTIEILLSARDINKNFKVGKNKLAVLKKIDLSINSGELVALMGPSGSGKSTLLNILGGLLKADDGTVEIEGTVYGNQSPVQLNDLRRTKIGWIFQNPNLLDHLNALDNVAFALTLSGIKIDEARDKAKLALTDIGLGDRLDFYPHQLSGGQNQRVSIARAISGKRALLLADEPTGNLDTASSQSIMNLFQGLCHDHINPISILMVTHDPIMASKADRIFLLKEGQVVPN